jgi:RNA polymerase sigma-70 factor, ECF subfamily
MEPELVTRAQRGDDEAFSRIANVMRWRLQARARGILRDDDLAEDATQQALLAIWRDLPQLRDPQRFDAWSYRLLVRACYAERRRSRQARIVTPSRYAPVQPDSSGSVADRDELDRGIRRLSADHRAVVVMHHGLDWSTARIANQLGVPVGTVRSRLHHALRGLRAALDADARPPVRNAVRRRALADGGGAARLRRR